MPPSVFRTAGAIVFACVALATAAPAPGQIAKLELHLLQSQTPTDQEFLTGRKDAKPVTVSGELRIPRPGTDRLPAVVLLHGSGGVTDREDAGRGSSPRWAWRHS